MKANLALRLQKLQQIPVVPGTRFTEIVTAFDGFPWAQDTVMAAALQLEEVLVMVLQRHMDIPGETLQRWTDRGELPQRALLSLAM